MEELEYRQNIDNVIYLCSCAVNGTVPDKGRTAVFSLGPLFEAAKNHMLTSITGQVLERTGVTTDFFRSAVVAAQRQAVLLNADLKNVLSELENAGIWYMPLKGTILKNLYPRFAMREMCDCDILFDADRAEDVKTIMEKLGFGVKSFGERNDDDYWKLPVSSFEMHRVLFGSMHDKKLYEYYKDIKRRLLKDENNNYGYHFSSEDFYIFMIAHESKHYNRSGTGLRSLLDIYVYLHAVDLDMSYVKTETEKLGIDKFEEKNRSLALKLFSEGALSEEEQIMFDYIIRSGTYGSLDHYVENQVKKEGKLKYLFRRICGPFEKNDPYCAQFRKKYTTFFKYPILLPFLPIYRFFKALKNKPKRILAEVTAVHKS